MSIEVPFPLPESHEWFESSRRGECRCDEHDAPDSRPARTAAPSSRRTAGRAPVVRRAGAQKRRERLTGAVTWRRVSQLDE